MKVAQKCILLYYFDQEFLRYKPSKIHPNPRFSATLRLLNVKATECCKRGSNHDIAASCESFFL